MPSTSKSVRSESDLIWLLLGVSETIPSGLSAFIAYPFLPVDSLLGGARIARATPWGQEGRNMVTRGVARKPFFAHPAIKKTSGRAGGGRVRGQFGRHGIRETNLGLRAAQIGSTAHRLGGQQAKQVGPRPLAKPCPQFV